MELNDFKAQLRRGKMPLGSQPKIQKLGTFRLDIVEATPVVWKGKLLFAEWIRSWSCPPETAIVVDGKRKNYTRFYDDVNDTVVGKPLAFDHGFICAYQENDTMYVVGVRRPSEGDASEEKILDIFSSTDLENWECISTIEMPDYVTRAFNTSLCKGPDGYVMVIEVSGDKAMIGRAFTILFATSPDMIHWEIKPVERYSLFKDRYTACPSIRYYDGYYYVVYLECWPTFRLEPYIVRTKDMETFDLGFFNPFMRFDDEDKKLMYPERLTEAQIERVENAVNINLSDIDFCDYNGKTRIVYSWGNQLGQEFLAQAEYDGTLEELLKAHFVD